MLRFLQHCVWHRHMVHDDDGVSLVDRCDLADHTPPNTPIPYCSNGSSLLLGLDMVKGGIDLLTHVMSMRPLLASMREIRMGKLVYFPERERGTSCHVLTLPRS